jgi:hypothetical protein
MKPTSEPRWARQDPPTWRVLSGSWRHLLLVAALLVPVLPGIRGVATGAADHPPVVEIDYFGEIGCSHCDTFVEKTVPRMEEEYGVSLSVETWDILSTDDYALCRDRLAAMDRPFRVFPVLFIGNNAYQGTTAVDRGLAEELAHLAEAGTFRLQVAPDQDGAVVAGGAGANAGAGTAAGAGTFALLPIVLAGLADGVNPCAFATVIFLISLLSLVGRSRGQTLATGLVFAATVFTTYFAIGLGLLSVFRELTHAAGVAIWIRVAVSVGTGVLAVLSIRDGFLISRGRQSDAVLGLSPRMRGRIHTVIRTRVRGEGILFATIGIAFLVSVMELACTGQLYLPTIAYLVQTGAAGPTEIFALGVYNLAFVTPLLAVVLITHFGVSSTRIARWFSRRVAVAKVLMGAVFAVLGVAIWLV